MILYPYSRSGAPAASDSSQTGGWIQILMGNIAVWQMKYIVKFIGSVDKIDPKKGQNL